MPLTDFQALVKAHIPAEKQEELLKEVGLVFDQSSVTEKVKLANADLTKDRERLETEVKAVKALLTPLETEKKNLEAKLAELQKGTPDQAVLNGLNDKIAALTQQVESEKSERQKAAQLAQEGDLKNAVLTAAGKAVNPSQVFALMQAEGRVGLKEGKPFFYKFNEKKEPVALDSKEAVETFLKENPHLEKSSGTGGSGTVTLPTGAPAQNGLLESPEAYLK